jgi:hypothetical protein
MGDINHDAMKLGGKNASHMKYFCKGNSIWLVPYPLVGFVVADLSRWVIFRDTFLSHIIRKKIFISDRDICQAEIHFGLIRHV